MHYIAVLDDIFLSFDRHFAGFADSRLASERNIIFIFDHFGTDKAFLKIRVDDTGTLGRL